MSPSFGKIEPQLIIEWILNDNLPIRIQLQIHKLIWPPEKTGV